MDITSDIKILKGIGDKSAEAINRLDIYNVGDLLNYYPRTYDTYKAPVEIAELKEGYIMSVEGMVTAVPRPVRAGRYTIINIYLKDSTGHVKLIWFNQPYLAKTVRPGIRYIFRGRISEKKNERIMVQPAVYTRDKYIQKMREMQPVYSICTGVTNNMLSKAIKQTQPVINSLNDYLSSKDRTQLGFIARKDAINSIHFPIDENQVITARERLVFDEFFSFLYTSRRLKKRNESKVKILGTYDFSYCDDLIAALDYQLTGAQLRVFSQIKQDLLSGAVKSRLIQGDVGCGKTIVAALSVLCAVMNGGQACVMAPTDVLARQHFEEFSRLFRSFGINIVFLSGSVTKAEKKKIYKMLESGEAQVVIGTHAIIQPTVSFKNLTLGVIDEQHRFGVNQRETLQNKGDNPYILVMSATPIPRSLALILYGDMDISVIDEMPCNRLPIKNCSVDTGYRQTAYNFIKKEIGFGHQAYIICPMIEENEELDAENVIDYTERLKDYYGNSICVEYLHGKMTDEEKNEVLQKFYNNEISVLVSTTVVEVGINVPNATVMLVENCERFGLSQLHQLRGRVGRGTAQSYCIFISQTSSDQVSDRMKILIESNNGFDIANKDLELRGPGDLKGTRQSGELSFKLADIVKDMQILNTAVAYINSLSDEELLKMSLKTPDLFTAVNSKADVL